MTDPQFEDLVRRLEHQARQDPRKYRLKVLLLAALGDAYVAAMLLLLVGLLIGLAVSIVVLKAIAIKLILVVGFFLWMVLKALWVKLEPPAGHRVSAAEAPELFAMIEDLRRQLGAPRFHQVLIGEDLNAGVVQLPRFGVAGGYRNTLLVGLPLLKALTPDQFKAVLAHEFCHLARGHGRMSNWIYRQRLRWSRLLDFLDAKESRGSFLFKPFLTWFAPYFGAYSFPLARANEYDADATSARLTAPRTAAEALTAVNVVASYLAERYWPHVHKQADDCPEPGFAPFQEVGGAVSAELDAARADIWLDQAMSRSTDLADTHPALADRLRALGEPPRLALPAEGAAADMLLGAALPAITEDFDRRWRNNILPSWQERHREVQQGRRRLGELEARVAAGEALSIEEAYERARLTEGVADRPEEALAQFRALHYRAPDYAPACFALGARLLSAADAEGCALIEEAMRLDEHATADGCRALRDYHWRRGNKEDAHRWHARLTERLALHDAAAAERRHIVLTDRFEPHGLPDEAIAELRRALKSVPGLRRAYLVKKRVMHFPQWPLYVFGFTANRWYWFSDRRRTQAIANHLQQSIAFPGETLIVNVEGTNRRFGRKFRWMRGTRVV